MATKSKKVLVLGAGYVSAPLVEYLSRSSNTGILLASALKDEANALADIYPNCEPILLDVVERPDLLKSLAEDMDVVISLLPYSLHPHVLKACINAKTNMVTASYCSPAMQELHEAAESAGITVVNEVGLDPGIDHLLAMECFEEIEQKGGKVESFVSYCGGLPAPENSDNPLRYKFSWSPRGALLNSKSGAKFIQDSEIVEIPPGGGLMDHKEDFTFLPGFALEGFPNRDSTIYRELYGVHGAKTFVRGTLRYKGYTEVIKALLKLGLLGENQNPMLHASGPDISWRQFTSAMCGHTNGTMLYDNSKALVREKLDTDAQLWALEELGLLKDDLVAKCGTPIDTLSFFLSKKLKLGSDERDIVILRHDIQVLWPDGRRELRGISFVNYGEIGGYSAMAKTVGYPTAIAAKMVLDGEIQQKGMVLPLKREIYNPMLTRLGEEGICAKEKSVFW